LADFFILWQNGNVQNKTDRRQPQLNEINTEQVKKEKSTRKVQLKCETTKQMNDNNNIQMRMHTGESKQLKLVLGNFYIKWRVF